MKKVLFILVIFVSFLYGDDLDSLLSEYRDANELSNETRESKNGHVIVYSRTDLDKMQAFVLNDVLKTIRGYTIGATRFGATGLVKSPYSEKAISSIKVYIDSYEVTSLTEGTGLNQFGRMGLGHIDHIEIYQASNAIAFNGEPGTMVVRLYTKDPSRENLSSMEISLDSRGSKRTQLVEARGFDDYTYMANLDLGDYNYKEYDMPNGSELSRDGRRAQVYLNFAKRDDFKVEFGSAIEKNNLFSGFGKAIDNGEFSLKNYYLQFTKYFANNIKLALNASCEQVKFLDRDNDGFKLQDKTISKYFESKVDADVYNAILEKRINYDKHEFLFGSQFKYRTLSVSKLHSNGVDKKQDILLGPRDLSVYMFYLEDRYSIDSDNAITVGAKLDIYDNHQTTPSKQKVFRVAYEHTFDDTTFLRAFVQSGYFYPDFSQTTFSPLYFTNPNLKSVKNRVAKVELEKGIENLTLVAGGGKSRSKDGIFFDSTTNSYINSPKNNDFWMYYINATYRLDADNKILIEYFKANRNGEKYSPDSGGLIQLYNKIGRLDIYNELIYRSSYDGVYGLDMDLGVDYTAGIIYHYSKKLELKLKGENLLNKASRIDINGLRVAPYDKRAILSAEYSF